MHNLELQVHVYWFILHFGFHMYLGFVFGGTPQTIQSVLF